MSDRATGSGERMGEPKITITASTELSPGLTHVCYSADQRHPGPDGSSWFERFIGTAIVGTVGAVLLPLAKRPPGVGADTIADLVFAAVGMQRAEMCPPVSDEPVWEPAGEGRSPVLERSTVCTELGLASNANLRDMLVAIRSMRSDRDRLCTALGFVRDAPITALIEAAENVRGQVADAKDRLVPWCAEADPGRMTLADIVSQLIAEVLEPLSRAHTPAVFSARQAIIEAGLDPSMSSAEAIRALAADRDAAATIGEVVGRLRERGSDTVSGFDWTEHMRRANSARDAALAKAQAHADETGESAEAVVVFTHEGLPINRVSLGTVMPREMDDLKAAIEEGVRAAEALPDRPGWWWCKIFDRWEPRFVHDPTGDGLEVYCAGPVSAYPEWGDRIPMPDDGEGEP